jgi:hypothetical protein
MPHAEVPEQVSAGRRDRANEPKVSLRPEISLFHQPLRAPFAVTATVGHTGDRRLTESIALRPECAGPNNAVGRYRRARGWCGDTITSGSSR